MQSKERIIMEHTMEQTTEQHNTESAAFLSLQHLEKVYPNGEKAVHDFNLDIKKNEFIVFVGPSGCGKSTTLRMIAGLEDITSGDLYLKEELLNYKPSNERNMALVFQSYALYPQMSVYDNIAFPLTINKYPMPVVNTTLRSIAEIRTLLDKVGFEDFAGALHDILKSSGKASRKTERIATVFGMTYDAAGLLTTLFDPWKNTSPEALLDKEADIRAAFCTELDRREAEERKNIASKNVTLNEDFCEVDSDGRIKTEYRKYTPYEIRTRVYETADKLDLTPYLDKLPKELSGGQMQRVALGRAIIKNVPVFLMDEPLSNLDAKLRLTMRSEIVKLHNRIGATTIYVTHDQTEAMTMASRIVVMSRGFVQQIGSPEEVYNDPANLFVARFIGSPPMNIFDMEFDHEQKTLTYGDFQIPVTDAFIEKHDALYNGLIERFSSMSEHFDQSAREAMQKILSVTGESRRTGGEQKEKEGVGTRIRHLLSGIGKEDHAEDSYAYEHDVCTQKLEQLKMCVSKKHTLSIGIRPRRIHIERKETGKEYRNALIVKPTLCELLGSEYNVHFDFCGKNMVGQLDARDKVTTKDDIVVQLSLDDLYAFDPITGEVIR